MKVLFRMECIVLVKVLFRMEWIVLVKVLFRMEWICFGVQSVETVSTLYNILSIGRASVFVMP